jgi:hypothetical protein
MEQARHGKKIPAHAVGVFFLATGYRSGFRNHASNLKAELKITKMGDSFRFKALIFSGLSFKWFFT